MAIQLKPGYWINRKDEIYKVEFKSIDKTLCYPWFAQDKEGNVETFDDQGKFGSLDDDPFNLIQQLPDDAGFNWKPAPKIIPWTKETCPVGRIIVNKASGNRYLIVGAMKNDVVLGGITCAKDYYSVLTYYDLESEDGKTLLPAGIGPIT